MSSKDGPVETHETFSPRSIENERQQSVLLEQQQEERRRNALEAKEQRDEQQRLARLVLAELARERREQRQRHLAQEPPQNPQSMLRIRPVVTRRRTEPSILERLIQKKTYEQNLGRWTLVENQHGTKVGVGSCGQTLLRVVENSSR